MGPYQQGVENPYYQQGYASYYGGYGYAMSPMGSYGPAAPAQAPARTVSTPTLVALFALVAVAILGYQYATAASEPAFGKTGLKALMRSRPEQPVIVTLTLAPTMDPKEAARVIGQYAGKEFFWSASSRSLRFVIEAGGMEGVVDQPWVEGLTYSVMRE